MAYWKQYEKNLVFFFFFLDGVSYTFSLCEVEMEKISV